MAVVFGLLVGGPATAQNNYLKAQQGPYRLSDVPENMPSAPILDDKAETQHLAFAVTVDFRCAPPSVARSTIVSVADSSASTAPDAPEGRQALTVKVPRSQLVGLSTAQACAGDLEASFESDADEPWALRYIPAAFAAYATLVCEDPEQERMATGTASVPLDVWVRCPVIAEESGEEATGDRGELALAEDMPDELEIGDAE